MALEENSELSEKLISDDEVVAAALSVRELVLTQADNLKGKLPSDVPRELKILLNLFNKYPEKRKLSIELFNDSTTKDVGNIFRKLVSQEDKDTVEYLESIIDPSHKSVFDQIKTHINYYYINYLLCYFLLKNANMNSVSSDEEIDDFIDGINIGDSTIQDAVKGMARSLIKLSSEKYTNSDAKQVLIESVGQISNFIRQQKQESMNNQSIMQVDKAEIDKLLSEKESLYFQLSEANDSIIGMDDLQFQLGIVMSANEDLVRSISQKRELDSDTMQKMLKDSEMFNTKMNEVMNIAFELEGGQIDYEQALVTLNSVVIVSDIENVNDELITTRNELFHKQQLQLALICTHIRNIIEIYLQYRRTIGIRVSENIGLTEEVERLNSLNRGYEARHHENVGIIIGMQREIEGCRHDISIISAAKDECEKYYKGSLDIQLREKSEIEQRYISLIGISRAMFMKIQMLKESEDALIQMTGQQTETEESQLHEIRMKDIELQRIQDELVKLQREKNRNDAMVQALQLHIMKATKESIQKKQEAELASEEKDQQIRQFEFDYATIVMQLSRLEETKKRELAEKQGEIDEILRKTKLEIEEANAYTEKVQANAYQARANIERIVQESETKLESLTLALFKERRSKENVAGNLKRINEQAKKDMNELISSTRAEILKLQKDKEAVESQLAKAKSDTLVEATFTELATDEISRLRDVIAALRVEIASKENSEEISKLELKLKATESQLVEAERDTSLEKTLKEIATDEITRLRKEIEKLQENSEEKPKLELKLKVAESQFNDAEERSRVAEFMNLVYLTKLSKFNQIILENRAKIEAQFGIEGQTQISGKDLKQLLDAIYSAQDEKTLLEAKREYTQETCSVLELADQLILSEPLAQTNVDTFLDTVGLAKIKIEELEQLVGEGSIKFDGLKEAYANIEAVYEADKSKRLEVEIELYASRKASYNIQLEAQEKIDELTRESIQRRDETFRISEAKINELLVQQVANREIIEDQATAIKKADADLRQILIRHEASRAKEIAAQTKEFAAHVKDAEEKAISVTESKAAGELADAKAELAEAKAEVVKMDEEKQAAMAKLKIAHGETYQISVQAGKDMALLKRIYDEQIKSAQFEL